MPADDDDRPSRPWDNKRRDDDDDRPRRDRGGRDDRPRRDRDEDDEDRPRGRRRYEGDDDYEHDRPRRKPQGSNGLAVAALILGILSLCTAGLTTIPAVICGLIALGKPTGRGLAVGGLVLGVLGGMAGVGLMLYGVVKVRESAARMSDSNNLKQIGLALQNQADVQNGFVGPYAVDERGTVSRGLSWRVGLLPYVEQQALYRQFDLTQPWDGPRNQAAANTKLKTYTAPQDGPEPSVNTPYRVFYGGGALFNEDGKPVRMVAITDGTSNTLLAVHATEQVPWAEPREFRYADTTPLPRLGPPNGNGANVLMADGSVRFVRNTIPERTMRLLITKADGNAIPPGDW